MEELMWRKASRSGGGNSDNCVEVAATPERVYLRDSKDQDGPMLKVTRSEWSAFVADLSR